MSSKVNMINVALVSLRAEPIALPIEGNEVGRKVLVVYDPLLRAYLRSHPWNFAKKETSLSRVDVTPELDDYAYVFNLPPDFIKLLKTSITEDGYTHKIKGRRIYCNSTTLSIEYIYFNEDPNSYDDAFVEAFSAKIAAELCYSITGDKKLVEIKWAEFNLKNNAARSSNGMEQSLDEPISTVFLNSRL